LQICIVGHDSRPTEGICIKDCNKEPNAPKPLGDSQLNNQTVIAAVSLNTEKKQLKVMNVKATATGKPTAANTTCNSSQCSATSTTPKSKHKLSKCTDGNSKQELYVSKLDKEKLPYKKNTQENVDLTDVLLNENVLSDDIIMGNTINNEFSFKPLTSANQDALCARLHLTNENNSVQGTNISSLGEPCKTKSIKGDGNCFYRCVAHALCGNEEKHLKIRREVVKHLNANSSKLIRYLREEYRSVKDYLTQRKMYYSGSWATEIDIFCTADLLKTNIFTFNDDRWNVHAPTDRVFTNNAIYLKHCNENHFEIVTCVTHKNEINVCAGACKAVCGNEIIITVVSLTLSFTFGLVCCVI